MLQKLIATWISVGTFAIAVITALAKVIARQVTVENKVAGMEKELCQIKERQYNEMKLLQVQVANNEKTVAVLTSQMADVKQSLTTIETKLDRLIAAS